MSNLSWITLLAFVLSVAFCIGFRELAREWYLIDIPDDRKRHDGAVPLCGGIAIFLAFAIAASIVQGTSDQANILQLLPGLALVLVTGVLDDRFNLPVMPRLSAQLLAAALIIGMAGIERLSLGMNIALPSTGPTAESGAIFLAGPLFLLLALTFIVGLINAVNMSDGVDGLAGASSAAAFFWLAVIGFDFGQHRLGLQTLALAAACLGFLVFNMRHRWRMKASLFLGDGGSTLLGAALAGTSLILASGEPAIAFPVLLWVVAVPVIDTLSLIIRRLAVRRSPFSADRQHLHHLLMDAGLSCGQTAMAVMALNLLAGAVAYIAIRTGVPAWIMLVSLLLPAVLHTLFVRRMTRGQHPAIVVAATIADTAQTAKPNLTFPGTTT
ncbi:undecaprenyl-phosphate alpha-N-acetylglucosaminyl 1-phosphate transferase [Ochrobactrum sp. P6BS-III]|uniref:MraY family glycosyltransferase n=1 Tax=unclassified Ochrobactrum TaxID=239106 RepID=UPI000992A470|nr:UDP-GlcNAc:undecaprenyl-phosphate GlcNAc-1-phosphate transferase [Ochrobactrum sp. P6BSIII]OOL16704.1 undecaprenyl-phosphate alpha-N-acetylglucosaminyl 1-phosphate transferase [Ochrobactrum sp. P6BS-III]